MGDQSLIMWAVLLFRMHVGYVSYIYGCGEFWLFLGGWEFHQKLLN